MEFTPVSPSSSDNLPRNPANEENKPVTAAVVNNSGVMPPSTENVKKSVGNPLDFIRGLLNSFLHRLHNAGQAIRNDFTAMRLRLSGSKNSGTNDLKELINMSLKPTTKPAMVRVPTPFPTLPSAVPTKSESTPMLQPEKEQSPKSSDSAPALVQTAVTTAAVNEEDQADVVSDDNSSDASSASPAVSDDEEELSSVDTEEESEVLAPTVGNDAASVEQPALNAPSETEGATLEAPSNDEDDVKAVSSSDDNDTEEVQSEEDDKSASAPEADDVKEEQSGLFSWCRGLFSR